MAGEHKPDLIFMDLKMPVLNGYEATRLLKSDETLRHIPVIALSASTSKTEPELIKQYGFAAYLKKPVCRIKLFQTLSRFLDYDEKNENVKFGDSLKIVAETLSPETLSKLPEVLQKLEDELTPLWENLQETQPVDEIKRFGEKMKTLGETCNLNVCIQFGEDLIGYIDRFDISNMLTTLNQFPELVKKLRIIRG